MTKVIIDADASPVTRDALSCARQRGLSVVLVANASQNLSRYEGRSGIEVVQVESDRDRADFVIIERLAPQDIVVTGDTGLAAMVLGRGARAVSFRGRIFHLATIDVEMAIRHHEQKFRRQGGRTRGPSAFMEKDREHFIRTLNRMLDEKPED